MPSTQTVEAGGVTVAVAWEERGIGLGFAVKLDNHQIDLDGVTLNGAVLTNDRGDRLEAKQWAAPPRRPPPRGNAPLRGPRRPVPRRREMGRTHAAADRLAQSAAAPLVAWGLPVTGLAAAFARPRSIPVRSVAIGGGAGVALLGAYLGLITQGLWPKVPVRIGRIVPGKLSRPTRTLQA